MYGLCTTLCAADINKVVFFVNGNKFIVAGSDDKRSVLVYEEFDNNDFANKTIGISNTPIFLKRLELFDLNIVKVGVFENELFTTSVDIKQGRKTISHSFVMPSRLHVPESLNPDDVVNEIVINKHEFDALAKAIQAVGTPEFFDMKGDGENIFIELMDETSDKFEDIMGENKTGNWLYSWRTDKLVKLLRYGMKEQDEIKIQIGDCGTMRIKIDGIIFFLLPQLKR